MSMIEYYFVKITICNLLADYGDYLEKGEVLLSKSWMRLPEVLDNSTRYDISPLSNE